MSGGWTKGDLRAEHVSADEGWSVMRGDREVAAYLSEADAQLYSAAPDLAEALAALMPTNINLNHPALRDDQIIPCDVTMGELRAAAAALSKARGEPSPSQGEAA